MGVGQNPAARLELEAFVAGLPPGGSGDTAIIAARAILADLLSGSGSSPARVERLRELADTDRQQVVPSLLQEAGRRVQSDGVEAAGAYLAELSARDPGMAAALRRGLAGGSGVDPWPPELGALVKSLPAGGITP